jgi:hypothetical protein
MKRRRSLYARPEIIRGEQCIGCAAIFDAPVMCEGTGCPTLWRAGQISAAAVGDCSSVPEIDPVTVAGLREHQARQARRPIPQRSARPTRSPAWCSRIRTVRRSTRTCSPTGSTARPGGRASGDPPTRPAPQLRDGRAGRRHTGEGRQRTTRARDHRYHHGYPQPRPAWPGRASRRDRGAADPGRRRA